MQEENNTITRIKEGTRHVLIGNILALFKSSRKIHPKTRCDKKE